MTDAPLPIIVEYLDASGTAQTFQGTTENLLHAQPGLVYQNANGSRTMYPWNRIISVTSDSTNDYWNYWGLY